jgi:exopolyphosphatase/guanosine-5'-triphosphate,3'-diphosphate pyrophosphatase
MDIGGGSTEFLLAQGEAIRATVSTGLGVVKLTEAHIRCDPPSLQELTAIREAATARLRILRERDLPSLGHGEIFVGTAGTVTSLAAMDLELDPYDPDRVNGHHLSRDQVAELSDRLARLPLRLRRATPGLEAARADVIVAGTVVCQAAMEILGYREIVVSDGGLREGILLDLIRQRAAEGQGSTNAKDENLSELRPGGPAKLDKPGVIC